MVFTAVGVILSPLVLGGKPIRFNAEAVQILAEITLIIVLFSDAATLKLKELESDWRLPARLLFVALPVALGLGFLKVDLSTRLFYGWFGPRGIASILYILVAVGEIGDIKGHETIFAVASLTILLSIVLHGLSAQPLAVRYARSHPATETSKDR